MNAVQNFWKDMPWYAKLTAIVLGALIYVNILYAKQVPQAIDNLADRVQQHATETAVANAQDSTARLEQRNNDDEQLRLLRSICVSMAVIAKRDGEKCF